MSPSSRYTTERVCSSTAEASDATNSSSSPIPSTTGDPRRVRDPARAVPRLALQMLGEPLHAPRELDDRHAGAVLDRNAGGVVAAILQATQTVHQNRRGLAFPHVSDDATHITGE